MKLAYFILSIFLTTAIYSHNIIIFDSITNDVLPFSIIIDGNSGKYSDEEGRFEFMDFNNDTITIRFLGYADKKIFVRNFELDTVRLISQSIQLEEIVLSNAKNEITIDYPKKPKHFGNFPVNIGQEILIELIPENQDKLYYLKSLKIPFDKNRNKPKIDDKFRAIIRVNIYALNGNVLFVSEPFEIKLNSKDELQLKLNERGIKFRDQGIRIGIEYLSLNNNSSLMNNTLPINPQLTENNYPGFRAKTYIKFPLEFTKEIMAINNIFPNIYENKTIDRKLMIELEIVER